MLRVVLLAALCACVTSSPGRKQFVREVLPGIGSYYFHPFAMNWTDAAQYCRVNQNSHLAFPYTSDEATLMSNMMKSYKTSYIHCGFHDQFREGEYYTTTGDRVSQACFKTWNSQTGGTDRNCGAFRDYPGLLDIACSTKYPFICVNYDFFREDFEYINGYGFYKMHRARRSWVEAQTTCEAESANLLVINSERELDALINRFGHFASWVGVHHKFVNWQFITIDDEPLSSTGFSRWMLGQPSGTNDNNPYLMINSNTGMGLAIQRGTDLLPFICEHRPGSPRLPPQ